MFKIFSKQKVKLQEIKKEEIQLKEQTDALSEVDEKYSLLYEKANKMFTEKNLEGNSAEQFYSLFIQ